MAKTSRPVRGQQFVHVNGKVIISNQRNGTDHPPIVIRTYGDHVEYVRGANVVDKDGKIIARFVYRPEKPTSCSARVWFETVDPAIKIEAAPLDPVAQ